MRIKIIQVDGINKYKELENQINLYIQGIENERKVIDVDIKRELHIGDYQDVESIAAVMKHRKRTMTEQVIFESIEE